MLGVEIALTGRRLRGVCSGLLRRDYGMPGVLRATLRLAGSATWRSSSSLSS